MANALDDKLLKIKGTVIRQGLSALYRTALGPNAAPFPAEDRPENQLCVPEESVTAAAIYFNNRKLSIYGGSNEIQRNIIAKGMFGV